MAKCPDDVVYGADVTSNWRKHNLGVAAGGGETSNSENYQRKAVEDGTGLDCKKTIYRINIRENTLQKLARPLGKNDGFDYTEDFDGVQNPEFGIVFISFKCVCKTPAGGGGGNQTRTLRECYHFIEAQLNFVQKREIFFANILDGDEADRRMDQFRYLLDLYPEKKHKVYVGNLKGYFDWFNKCATSE